MKHKTNALFLIGMITCLILLEMMGWLGETTVQAAGTLYVDNDSTCTGSCGNSWAAAFPTLQEALATAVSGDQIWVAAGIYYPDEGGGQTNDDRAAAFALQDGVAIYGGFAGTETELAQRDWVANPTILSGDIDQNDTTNADGVVTDVTNIMGSNAYHVVTGSGVTNTAVLDGFIITAGQASGTAPTRNGGGFFSLDGSPTLAYLALSGNMADLLGGGMYLEGGSAAVTAVTLSNNRAGRGGGIATTSTMASFTDVIIENNSVTDSYGGGMYNSTSDPTLNQVTIRGNVGTRGGGMANLTSKPVLTDVRIEGNSAGSLYGGGIFNSSGSHATLANVEIISNTAAYGGGMYNGGSFPTISGTTFAGNSASSYGSGLYNLSSDPELTNVLFHNNSGGTQGGGMYNASSSPTLLNVTFSGNSASNYGGGIRNHDSSPSLTNVTISGNSAGSYGGGMYNVNSFPTVVNSTFSGNSAVSFDGGGMYNFSGSPLLTNTIIANSTSGGDCVNNGANGGSVNATSSHNLIEDDGASACDLTNGTNNNIIGQDPNLSPLQNNGGPLETHKLLADSPAIDAGDNAACPPTDQRGVARPQPSGGQCDIGAVEYDGTAPVPVSIVRVATNPTTADSVEFLVTFSEVVTGVDTADFITTNEGTLTGTAVTGVTGSSATYTVTVSTGTEGGSLRLDVANTATAQDIVGNPLAGIPYTGGETYTILGIDVFIPLVVR